MADRRRGEEKRRREEKEEVEPSKMHERERKQIQKFIKGKEVKSKMLYSESIHAKYEILKQYNTQMPTFLTVHRIHVFIVNEK